MPYKNINIPFSKNKKIFFVGATGSGKTEIALNYACLLAKHLNKKIYLMDLDMIKPYFRLRNVKKEFCKNNVEIITPGGKLDYVDFPGITPDMVSSVMDGSLSLVADAGGDDVGARIIGRFSHILRSIGADFYYVYNGMRPYPRGESDTLEIMSAIEAAGRFKLTGIVHNSHLMGESGVSILKENIEKVNLIAVLKGIPVIMHCIREDMYEDASKEITDISIMPLKLFLMPKWL